MQTNHNIQYSTVQYSIVQNSTVECSRYSAVQQQIEGSSDEISSLTISLATLHSIRGTTLHLIIVLHYINERVTTLHLKRGTTPALNCNSLGGFVADSLAWEIWKRCPNIESCKVIMISLKIFYLEMYFRNNFISVQIQAFRLHSCWYISGVQMVRTTAV